MEAFFRRLHGQALSRDNKDIMSWRVSKKGFFTVKSFYSNLVPCNGREFPSSLVWNPWVPKRVIFFFLGGYLGKNSNYGSTKKERLDLTKQVLFV